jgi:GTPase SAR1 family protein
MQVDLKDLWKRLGAVIKKRRILLLGLRGAGKSSILKKMLPGKVTTETPVQGVLVEKISKKNVIFTSWNLPCEHLTSEQFSNYFKKVEGIIFVVDSIDRNSMEIAREELQALLKHPGLADTYLLVFANKQESMSAVGVGEMTDILGLNNLRYRHWSIQALSATSGDGLRDGLMWIASMIRPRNH